MKDTGNPELPPASPQPRPGVHRNPTSTDAVCHVVQLTPLPQGSSHVMWTVEYLVHRGPFSPCKALTIPCSDTQIYTGDSLTGGAEASEDRERGTEQAPPKAPPHSFLPNLQPGRQSAAARRGQVLAGPLTRASTPQSRTQVGSRLEACSNQLCQTPGSWERQLMLSMQASVFARENVAQMLLPCQSSL